MKLGPVTKLDKRDKTPKKQKKKKDDDVMSETCDVIVIFKCMANLELSGSRIPDA